MQAFGIIDLNGLDSLGFADVTADIANVFEGGRPHDSVQSMMFGLNMRARYNGQRHCVVFCAELDEESIEIIEQESDPIQQAVLVMSQSSKFGFQKGCHTDWVQEVVAPLISLV